MKIKDGGWITLIHGVRTLVYFVLIILVSASSNLLTSRIRFCIALGLFIFILLICFPERVSGGNKARAFFEAALTLLIFLGGYVQIDFNFTLGLMILGGYNLTMMFAAIVDGRHD